MKAKPVKEVKEIFLKNTFQYLVERGIDSVSLRDICKGTGISMGSIYYWFDGKEGIVIAATEYGLGKVVNQIYDGANKEFKEISEFFDSLIKMVSAHKKELRLIYQVATSPLYGERMRKRALEINSLYNEYIADFAEKVNCRQEELEPLVYMFIAIILDYIIWEDAEKTQMQIEYITKAVSQLVKAK